MIRIYYFKISLCISILVALTLSLQGQTVFRGVVLEKDRLIPISDVTITDLRTENISITDSIGQFEITVENGATEIQLSFSSIGYVSHSAAYSTIESPVTVLLEPQVVAVEEVEINTGYQWVPRERATGSFVHVKAEELAAIPGRSIINKLDGIMPGLQFDNRNTGPLSTGESVITVRGMNTFSPASSAPLIVVDNFPYEGNIENINPNDVESITLMRDAAATSIWGARAGNGVIVINLKKPEQSGKTIVNLSSEMIIVDKPDLFYQPSMTSSEFVDVELFLYEQNHYRSALAGVNAYRTVFSPVVQAMYDFETGRIDQTQLDRIIESARHHDYRHEMLDYYYKNQINHRTHLNVSKSMGAYSMRLSGGYDRMNHVDNFAVGNQSNTRYSFMLRNNYRFNSKLSADLNINYSLYDNESVGGSHFPFNPGGGKTRLYPYARLMDENGHALPIPRDLNPNFVDTVGEGVLLDWRFMPMDDPNHMIRDSRVSKINPSLSLRYSITPDFQLEGLYDVGYQFTQSGTRSGVGSYVVRDNVNRFTIIDGEQVVRNFPLGELYVHGNADAVSHRMRFNAKLDRELFTDHRMTWIVGGEISDVSSSGSSQRTYGYKHFNSTSAAVDHVTRHPLFLGGSNTISNGEVFTWRVQRMVSFFGNASYTLKDRYIFSGSIRRDASNVFGVKANERWNPLWSVGFAWNMHREEFIENIDWISRLRLKATHGHSGNLGGGTTSDRAVIYHRQNSTYTNLPYAHISSPPNPSLKWENVQMNNYSVEFSLFHGKVVGVFDYFRKRVTDLISHDPMDYTTGYNFMDRNVAGIKGEGIDISLNVEPLKGSFKWNMGVSFSYVQDIVAEFYGTQATNANLVSRDNTVAPMIEKHLIPVHSYRFGGLDPDNGDPMGYLNGEISKNYTAISRDSVHNLVYHGSGRPLYHGFINQRFDYKGFSLFFNVGFRAGHYFRENTISYNALYNSWTTHSDFSNRWQNPGDELLTTVPSMSYPGNNSRDNFYAGSEVNVKRGDVVRLKQARLSYSWTSAFWKIQRIDAGIHASNLGVLWKASKGTRDPDYLSIPPSREISASLNVYF